MEKSEFRMLIKQYFLHGKNLSETKANLDIAYFVSSAERRILTRERFAKRAEVRRVVSALVATRSHGKIIEIL